MMRDLLLEALERYRDVPTAVAHVRRAMQQVPISEDELTQVGRQAGAYAANATTREVMRRIGTPRARQAGRAMQVRADAAGAGMPARTRYERGVRLEVGAMGLGLPSGPVYQWAVENAQLIRGLEERTLQELERNERMQRATTIRKLVSEDLLNRIGEGESTEEIAKAIRARLGIAERRARLIARDQIGKLTGRITQERHRQLGITHYRWQTSEDERVRPEHRALNDTIRRWDDPHPTEGHPGQAINCRCVAVPVLPEELESGLIKDPSPPPTPAPEPTPEPTSVDRWRAFVEDHPNPSTRFAEGRTAADNPLFAPDVTKRTLMEGAEVPGAEFPLKAEDDPTIVEEDESTWLDREAVERVYTRTRVRFQDIASAQNDVDADHVEALLKRDTPAEALPMLTPWSDGRFQVEDGNHRLVAESMKGGEDTEALVFTGWMQNTRTGERWRFNEQTQTIERGTPTRQPTPTSAVPDLEIRIADVYRALPKTGGAGFARLADLREALPDVDREELDAAFTKMSRARSLLAIPEDNAVDITDRDRDATLRLGGHDLQWFKLRD